jgi:hypothetical protein
MDDTPESARNQRLYRLLECSSDDTIETQSVAEVGTSLRIFFPRRYNN